MNRKEIAAIRARLNPDKCAIPAIHGCYVNEKREIVSEFNRALMTFPQEEQEKYLALFKRILAGAPGKNLVDIEFRPDQVMNSDNHKLLMGLRNTELKVEEGVTALYHKIIDGVTFEGNYLILLAHDAYDIPYHGHDENKADDFSEETFSYILCAICPVKLSKPALSYFSQDNEFHARELDWVVGAPEIGFMFPAYEEGGSNIYKAVYFTRDSETLYDDFVSTVFEAETPMPADVQRETFTEILEEALEDELSYEVIQTVNEEMRGRVEEQKKDKEAPPATITKHDVSSILQDCGVSEEKVAAFEQKYDSTLGVAAELGVQNIVDTKRLEVHTPDIVIQVSPEKSDLIETRVIDGFRYILIRADEGVEVNGVNIKISE